MCVSVCITFHFEAHLKSDWRVSQQISGVTFDLGTARPAEHISTTMRSRTRVHTYAELSLLVATDTHTSGARAHAHVKVQSYKQTCSQMHTFKAHTRTCKGPETFPHIEANGLGINSIPFCFSVYSGKVCPLTLSISSIHEGDSQGTPCSSAKSERRDGLMPIIYVPGVSSLNPTGFLSARFILLKELVINWYLEAKVYIIQSEITAFFSLYLHFVLQTERNS